MSMLEIYLILWKGINVKTKFKVNDKVRIIKEYGAPLPRGFRIGSVGVVVSLYSYNKPYNYEVRLGNNHSGPFGARELERFNKWVIQYGKPGMVQLK